MMSKPVIQINDIYKTYANVPQKVEVIKGVSFEVKRSEVIVIMGPSGVGKSTLLHLMGGLDMPSAGEIYIDGQNIMKLRNDQLARFRNRNIGFVFQFHHLLPEFTALENVQIPAMMYESLTPEREEYARYILDQVGLSHRLDHKPRELSGGEQQRVAVARALTNEPQVILADEPTGNLDKQNGEALYNLLLELNRKLGQTLVIVTHNEHMTEQADRIIELDDGQLVRKK
jgi:lipoprotein-releasing system ATP-binding protein